jgi:hypothetical protein
MLKLHSDIGSACPACTSPQVSRHDDQTIVEKVVLLVMKIYPFRCHSCHQRFYLFLPKPALLREETARM